MPTPLEAEFGAVEAVEIKRSMRHGAMRPLLCQADDGESYVLKPYSEGRTWPLTLEWVCARLGRRVGLPIPNYRQVTVSPELAEAWNSLHERKIEAGIGFGSRLLPSAIEFDASFMPNLPEELCLRVLAFDWWIRNPDRTPKNPNLLWSAGSRTVHVIDHDQAAHPEDATVFWGAHLFKTLATVGLPWPPRELASEFATAAAGLLPHPLASELPSTWTSDPGALTSFSQQLTRSLADPPHRDWRQHD